jgi:hypothetical protein
VVLNRLFRTEEAIDISGAEGPLAERRGSGGHFDMVLFVSRKRLTRSQHRAEDTRHFELEEQGW